MFDSFFNKDERLQKESENRMMNFQREQSAFHISAPGDATEIQMQEQKSDLIKWQQDLDDELIELVATLKGYKKVNGEWILPEKANPLCNDLFIDNVVIPNCKPLISRNTINTNYSEVRLLNTLKNTMKTITTNMKNNYEYYDIKFPNYDIVWRIILNHIQPSMFRALNGFTKRTDSTIFKRLESSIDNQMDHNKKGLFNFGK